ncbi:MAG TPA: amidase family protein, partial [Blastocatellia bacterium]|nr:amidase family protein [Blastocatellia bacterium]
STGNVQPEVKKNFEESVKALRQFCDIDEAVAFPDLPFGQVVGLIVGAEGASAFRQLVDSGDATKLRAANDRWGGYAASMVLAVDYLQAMRVRERMKRALDDLYANYDALIAPSRATVSYPIGVDFDKAYPELSARPPASAGAPATPPPAVIPAGNAAGQPAISVPNGFGQNNLPTGIQFTGRAWGEAKLVAIASAYQQATDWHKRRPPAK